MPFTWPTLTHDYYADTEREISSDANEYNTNEDTFVAIGSAVNIYDDKVKVRIEGDLRREGTDYGTNCSIAYRINGGSWVTFGQSNSTTYQTFSATEVAVYSGDQIEFGINSGNNYTDCYAYATNLKVTITHRYGAILET